MNPCKFLIMGGRSDQIEPAYASGAGIVCFDLEDTVPAEAKHAVRALVPEFLSRGRSVKCERSVRISALSTVDGLKDLLMIMDLVELPDSLVLAKIESREEIGLVRSILSERAARVRINVIVETASALANVESIAAATGVSSLILGGKDLSEALRIERAWAPLLYARARCAAAAALVGIPIFDEPYSRRDDLQGLAEEAGRSKAMGFTGKAAVDLRHVEVINSAFSAGRS